MPPPFGLLSGTGVGRLVKGGFGCFLGIIYLQINNLLHAESLWGPGESSE